MASADGRDWTYEDQEADEVRRGGAGMSTNAERREHPRLRLDENGAVTLEREYVYAEDIDGVWHVRRDDFWDNDPTAKTRAHAACGEDIWSCHVSAFPPILGDQKARHCRGCFPLGRKSRAVRG